MLDKCVQDVQELIDDLREEISDLKHDCKHAADEAVSAYVFLLEELIPRIENTPPWNEPLSEEWLLLRKIRTKLGHH